MSLLTSDSELLVFGYIHNNEKQYDILIPSELYTIVLIFYPRKYKLFGIGLFGHFKKENEKYENKQWQYLSKMSSLCQNPNFISCANNNFFIRNMSNEIYTCGNNVYGSLGIDSQQAMVYDFTKVQFKDNINKDDILDVMSKGSFTNHTFVVLKNINTDTQVFYGFGKNSDGQQGYKSSKPNYYPTKLPALNLLFKHTRIIQINTGYSHSLFLTEKGKVFSCGDNPYGQCGIKIDVNENANYVKPQIIPLLYDITNISSGDYHNLCIDKDNRVWVFGDNNSNQLGLGEQYKEKSWSDIPIMNPYFKGDVEDNKVIFVECGDNFSLCISQNGKAFMFGENDLGQCGNRIADYRYIHIPFCIQSMDAFKHILFESGSLGCDHTQLISYYPHNNLYGFGSNSNHETGNLTNSYDIKVPYLNARTDIGIESNTKIVGVLCDEGVTVVICEM